MLITMTRLSFMYYVVLHGEDCLMMFFLWKWLEDIWSLSNSRGTFDINSFVRFVSLFKTKMKSKILSFEHGLQNCYFCTSIYSTSIVFSCYLMYIIKRRKIPSPSPEIEFFPPAQNSFKCNFILKRLIS